MQQGAHKFSFHQRFALRPGPPAGWKQVQLHFHWKCGVKKTVPVTKTGFEPPLPENMTCLLFAPIHAIPCVFAVKYRRSGTVTHWTWHINLNSVFNSKTGCESALAIDPTCSLSHLQRGGGIPCRAFLWIELNHLSTITVSDTRSERESNFCGLQLTLSRVEAPATRRCTGTRVRRASWWRERTAGA